MQVSVGRLGIITQVKLPIKAQKAVKRSLDIMSMDTFTQQLVQVEQKYKAALQSGDEGAIFKALEPVEAVQVSPISLSGEACDYAWNAEGPSAQKQAVLGMCGGCCQA